MAEQEQVEGEALPKGTQPLEQGDPTVLDGYRLLARLGEGGQGRVYLALTSSGERVAVKALHPDLLSDPFARKQLADEVAAARRVPSFCTARLLDSRLVGRIPYLVTEFVDGPSLADHVRHAGPLPEGELTRLAASTLTALITIHSAKVVHHDIKPGNVLLGPDGARLVDFGIATAIGTHSAGAQSPYGVLATPAFMAPEQLGPGASTPASDVFAWAATITFAATGRSPFHAPEQKALLYRLEKMDPDLAGVPVGIRPLLRICLAKDPALRPSAQQALARLLTDLQPDGGSGAQAPAAQPPTAQPTRQLAGQSTRADPAPVGIPSWGTPSAPVPAVAAGAAASTAPTRPPLPQPPMPQPPLPRPPMPQPPLSRPPMPRPPGFQPPMPPAPYSPPWPGSQPTVHRPQQVPPINPYSYPGSPGPLTRTEPYRRPRRFRRRALFLIVPALLLVGHLDHDDHPGPQIGQVQEQHAVPGQALDNLLTSSSFGASGHLFAVMEPGGSFTWRQADQPALYSMNNTVPLQGLTPAPAGTRSPAAVSGDGRVMAVATGAGFRTWFTIDGTAQSAAVTAPGTVRGLALDRAGDLLAVTWEDADDGYWARIWSAKTGWAGEPLRIERKTDVLLNPAGDRLVYTPKGSDRLTVSAVLTPGTDRTALDGCREADQLAFGAGDTAYCITKGGVSAWDLAGGQEKGKAVSTPQGEKAVRLAVMPGGKRLVTLSEVGSDVGLLQVWDLASGHAVGQGLRLSLSDPPDSISVSPDGTRILLLTGADDHGQGGRALIVTADDAGTLALP